MLEDWRTDRQTDKGYDNGISCQERMITPEDGSLTLAYRLSYSPHHTAIVRCYIVDV
jgi:hypothetical protein